MESNELRISAVETKVDSIGEQITAGFELILARLDGLDARIAELKGGAKGNLGAVEIAVNDGFKKVIEELKKINHVTRYEDQIKNTPKLPN